MDLDDILNRNTLIAGDGSDTAYRLMLPLLGTISYAGVARVSGHVGVKLVTDLRALTDTEIDAVAGGNAYQTIIINANQTNTSNVTQTATAINFGAVSAGASGTGSVAAAAGASASNVAIVTQGNGIFAANSVGPGHHHH